MTLVSSRSQSSQIHWISHLMVVGLLCLWGCGGGELAPVVMTAADFEDQVVSGPSSSLVIFSSEQDSPSDLEQLTTELQATVRGRIPTFHLRTTPDDWAHESFGVRQTPVVLAYRAGREIGRFVGPFQSRPLSLWLTEVAQPVAEPVRVPDSPPPAQLERAEFETLISSTETPVLIDFWAEWCGPCRMIEPHLHELADDLRGRLVIAKVNVDEQREIARDYIHQGLPLMVLFHRGREVDRFTGAPPRETLRRWVLDAVNKLGQSEAETEDPPRAQADRQ